MRWRVVEAVGSWHWPTTGGCYAIYMDGELAYVGSSGNLRSRLGAYRLRHAYGPGFITPWGNCQTLAVKVRESRFYGDWATLELRLLRRLMPRQNYRDARRRRTA